MEGNYISNDNNTQNTIDANTTITNTNASESMSINLFVLKLLYLNFTHKMSGIFNVTVNEFDKSLKKQ